MKRIFGLLLLAALLSAGTLCIAGDMRAAPRGGSAGCSTASCPIPCGMCR